MGCGKAVEEIIKRNLKWFSGGFSITMKVRSNGSVRLEGIHRLGDFEEPSNQCYEDCL